MTSPLITPALRDHLQKFVPDALGRALQSYDVFLHAPLPDDPKGFLAHHQACKMAIAHIDMLLKLARLVTPETDQDTDQPASLSRLIAQATADTDAYRMDVSADDAD